VVQPFSCEQEVPAIVVIYFQLMAMQEEVSQRFGNGPILLMKNIKTSTDHGAATYMQGKHSCFFSFKPAILDGGLAITLTFFTAAKRYRLFAATMMTSMRRKI